MSRNRIMGYVVSHFVGNQSLAWSFFINGIVFYFLLVIAVLAVAHQLSRFGIEGGIGVEVAIVFLCGLIWSLVGNTRAAIKVLRNNGSSFFKKFCAVFVIGVVLVTLVYLVNDVFRLGLWNIIS